MVIQPKCFLCYFCCGRYWKMEQCSVATAQEWKCAALQRRVFLCLFLLSWLQSMYVNVSGLYWFIIIINLNYNLLFNSVPNRWCCNCENCIFYFYFYLFYFFTNSYKLAGFYLILEVKHQALCSWVDFCHPSLFQLRHQTAPMNYLQCANHSIYHFCFT